MKSLILLVHLQLHSLLLPNQTLITLSASPIKHSHHMPILSTPLFSHRISPLGSAVLRSFSIATARHRNPDDVSRKSPNKHLLKARDSVKHFSSLSPALAPVDKLQLSVKHFSSLSPALAPVDKLQLSQNQAVGMVASAQANSMRVVIESVPYELCTMPRTESFGEDLGEGRKIGVELLCVVRSLLKKIKRRVMVGDKVLVGSIDWVDRRLTPKFPEEPLTILPSIPFELTPKLDGRANLKLGE